MTYITKLLGTAVVASLASVGLPLWASAAEAPAFDIQLDEAIRIKVAHVAQERQSTHQAMLRMKELVETATDGQVELEIFPGGVLSGGDGGVELDQTINGTVQMTPTITPYASHLDPRLSLVSLPFLFGSHEDVRTFIDTQDGLLNEMAGWLEPHGLVVTNWWPRGFRQFWHNDHTVRSPEDLSGARIRVMGDRLFVNSAETLGASPVPMAWGEVYTALQTGAIDAVEPPLSDGFNSSLHEVAENITMSNYTTDLQFLAWNKPFWDGLPKEVQDVLVWAGDEAGKYKGEIEIANEQDARASLVDAGAVVTDLGNAELRAFKDRLAPIYESYEEEFGDFVPRLLAATN